MEFHKEKTNPISLKKNFKNCNFGLPSSLNVILILFFFAMGNFLFALEVPALKGRVNDYAGIVNDKTEKEIEEYLSSLEQDYNIQMAVLTVPSLEGDDIASFGIRVADKWKIGSKEKDDGAILIVAYQEHSLRIEVGDGLEGTLTDAKCGLIIRNVIIPCFKDGNYSQGILKGIKNMGGVATGDMESVNKRVSQDNDTSDVNVGTIIAILFWLIFFFAIASSKSGLWKWFFFSRMTRGSRTYRPYKNNSPFMGNSKSSFTSQNPNKGFSGMGSSSFTQGFHGGGGHFSGGGASGHW